MIIPYIHWYTCRHCCWSIWKWGSVTKWRCSCQPLNWWGFSYWLFLLEYLNMFVNVRISVLTTSLRKLCHSLAWLFVIGPSLLQTCHSSQVKFLQTGSFKAWDKLSILKYSVFLHKSLITLSNNVTLCYNFLVIAAMSVVMIIGIVKLWHVYTLSHFYITVYYVILKIEWVNRAIILNTFVQMTM